MEKWKILEKNESVFMVSDRGNVMRLKDGEYIDSTKYLGGGHIDNHYVMTADKRKNYYVHRLVAEAFIGEIPKGFQVNHLDGDKHNNVPSNLEIVTRLQNMQHAHHLGLIEKSYKKPQPKWFILDEEKRTVVTFYEDKQVAFFLVYQGLIMEGKLKDEIKVFEDDQKYSLVRAV